MGIGDPCAPLFGWTILAIREPCPVHGLIRYDLQGPRQRYFNACPRCWRDEKNISARRKRAHTKKLYPPPGHSPMRDMEGHEYNVMHPQWWKKEYDNNIRKFWADRGMTDEDAKCKFSLRPRLIDRRHEGRGAMQPNV